MAGLHAPPGRRGSFLALAAVLLATATPFPAPASPLAPATPAGDAFAPGLRWRRRAAPARPWIPRDVVLAAGGELVGVAADGDSGHLALLTGARGRPVCVDRSVAHAEGPRAVAAGRDGRSLLSMVQLPDPDPQSRRTRLAAHDVLAPGTSPLWTHDPGPVGSGVARLACGADGQRAVLAVHDVASGNVQIDWISVADGDLEARTLLAGGAPRYLVAADDGSRAALVADLDAWVLGPGGALHHEPLAVATDGLALSGDGRRLALGGSGVLRVLSESGGTWSETLRVDGVPGELVACAALSGTGDVVAIGWWSAASGAGRFQVLEDGGERVDVPLPAGSGGLQNLPVAVRVTPDGRRAALGAWGAGGPEPEVILHDLASGLVLQRDLPGSVLDLDLDSSGTRLVLAMKHAHANRFASTGEVRLVDTGEAELAVLRQPDAHGPLVAAARELGAGRALLLIGRRATSPAPISGAGGLLELDRSAGIAIHAARPDAAGSFGWRLAPVGLPPGPLALQVLFERPSGRVLGGSVRDLPLLP